MLIEGQDGAGKSALPSAFPTGSPPRTPTSPTSPRSSSPGEFVQQMHLHSCRRSQSAVGRTVAVLAREHRHARRGERTPAPRATSRARRRSGRPTWSSSIPSALLRNDPNYEGVIEAGDEDHVIQRLVTFLRQMTMKDKSVVLTVDPTSVRDDALRPLRNVADIYFQIETNTVGQEIRRKVLVRRFQNMKSPVDDSIGFSVQQGRGISIVSRTVA